MRHDSDGDSNFSIIHMTHPVTQSYIDAIDLAKMIGFFTAPTMWMTWESYRNKFKRAAEQSYIPRERWGEIVPDLLREQANYQCNGKAHSLKRSLTYMEICDMLSRIFREFEVTEKEAEELNAHLQRDNEGVAAFAMALKHLAGKAFPGS